MRWLVGFLVVSLIVVGLGIWAAANPYINIPVVSPLVCSMKGESWFDRPDALYGVDRPGCYRVAEPAGVS
jgi:hypothetical protein